MKINANFIVAMSTAIASFILFFIKCKLRCVSSEEVETRKLIQKLGKRHAYLNWNDPRLPSVTESTHELVHHSTTHELNYVLLLISDCVRIIIIRIWIKYDALIK